MSQRLSPAQAAALLDILTHYDTYAEIRDFRYPGILDHYGPPFTSGSKTPSTSPSLQALVSRFLLSLPGLKDVPEDFWKVQAHSLMEALEKANLSESYDKGVIGSRKTLATAISALIEYPVRGVYGGFSQVQNPKHEYDLHNADDLGRAFRDFVSECIYGNVLEDVARKAAETDQLEKHGQLVKGVHAFVVVNLASFMHYTLILSPKGQYLLKLIDNANKLIPYVVIRQTLKIGNVASMIGALMKVILAKMSVTSITNWMGLTQGHDEGMNLLQQIVATVLGWDMKDLESRASKTEKDKSGISKEQAAVLKDYTTKTREEQESIRRQSQKSSTSIVLAILANASKPSDLSEHAHEAALEYVSIHLSIRDRKEIIQVLCHSSPDHLTNLVRSVVTAYEPVIRHMHNAIDLSDTVADFQSFLNDMLKMSRIQPAGKDGKTAVPTVGDFIQLLKKHQYSSHKFIHQLCKNGKEVVGWYLGWAKHAASQFRRESTPADPKDPHDAGDLTAPLGEIFGELPSEQQDKILPVLDAHIHYLDEMHAASTKRLELVLKSAPSKNAQISKILSGNVSRPSSRPASRAASPSPPTARAGAGDETSRPHTHSHSHSQTQNTPHVASDPGPGAFLARWQDLLDNTRITPLRPHGKPMRASDSEVVESSATDVTGEKMVEYAGGTTNAGGKGDGSKKRHIGKIELDMHKIKLAIPTPTSTPTSTPSSPTAARSTGVPAAAKVNQKPDSRVVVDAMGEKFRTLLGARGLDW